MGETKICETCKHESNEPEEVPCIECERASRWESTQSGCDFCKNIKKMYRYEIWREDKDGSKDVVFDDDDLNYCPMCRRKLKGDSENV